MPRKRQILLLKKKKRKRTRLPLSDDKERLNLILPSDLKVWLQKYAAKRNTTVTALIVQHFSALRAEDEIPDVRQI